MVSFGRREFPSLRSMTQGSVLGFSPTIIGTLSLMKILAYLLLIASTLLFI